MTLLGGLKSQGWDVHLLITNTRGDYFNEISKSCHCYDLSSFPLSPKKVFMAADLVNSLMPDIVLMNNCALLQYALPLINPTIKPIAVLHSNDDRFYAIASIFSRRVFRWVAPTIGLVEPIKVLINRKLHSRIKVIPHGVDCNKFFPERNERNAEHFQIVFIGFLGETKGAELLPEIFQAVAEKLPNAFLTIVGDGPLREHLRLEFAKRSIQSRVLMCGRTPWEQIAVMMRASHVLLLPTNLEGFGIVIIESMMCGVVPVVSRLAGITDQIVQHGKTGFLITPKHIEGFAEAIIELAHNDNLLETMSTNAQNAAAAEFSLDTMINRYEMLFAETEDRKIYSTHNIPFWFVEASYQALRKRFR